LGYLNKTCKAGTDPTNYGSTCGPVLRAQNNGKQWKQWALKVAGGPTPSSAVDATIANYYPNSAGKPLCVG